MKIRHTDLKFLKALGKIVKYDGDKLKFINSKISNSRRSIHLLVRNNLDILYNETSGNILKCKDNKYIIVEPNVVPISKLYRITTIRIFLHRNKYQLRQKFLYEPVNKLNTKDKIIFKSRKEWYD